MKNDSSNLHWNKRAHLSTVYKNEIFYTITPLPFYVKRRELLIKSIKDYFNVERVCDFGCGDGWYVNKFINNVNHKKYYGIDISEKMIEKAKINNPNISFLKSEIGLDVFEKEVKFDLIYSIAVLAHIPNDLLKPILITIEKHLDNKGRYIIFEQVAPFYYSGNNFHRRTINDYKYLFVESGFNIESVKLFSFTCHRFFEHRIAKLYYKHFCKSEIDVERRVEANNHFLFRLLSAFFLFFDINPIKNRTEKGWGNVLIILNKNK